MRFTSQHTASYTMCVLQFLNQIASILLRCQHLTNHLTDKYPAIYRHTFFMAHKPDVFLFKLHTLLRMDVFVLFFAHHYHYFFNVFFSLVLLFITVYFIATLQFVSIYDDVRVPVKRQTFDTSKYTANEIEEPAKMRKQVR